MFLKVVARKDVVYVVGATKGVASLSLNVVVLSASTGQLLHDREIPSGITNTLTDVFTFYDAHKTTEPVLVWVENTSLKSLVLDSTLSNKPHDVKTAEKLMYLLDLGLTNHGQVLAQLPDGSSRLLQVSQDGTTASSLYEFDSKRLGVLFNGGVDDQGRPYVARTHWSQDLNTIVLDVVNASSTTDQTQTYTVPFDTNNEGILDHIAFTLPSSGAPHLLTTASSGAVQLFGSPSLTTSDSKSPSTPDALNHHWTRHEALATTTLATFVELPEPLVISTTADFTKSEGFTGRLLRHAVEARDLPRYIVNFVRRFVTGDYASATSAAVVIPGSSIPLDAEAATTNTNTNTTMTTTPQTTPLFRDPFSFRQILLTFTAPGKIYALDSSNGEIVWTRTLGLGSAFWMGGSVSARKVWVVRGVNDVVVGEGVEEGKDKVRAEVVLVAERRASNGQATTMIYHFNALTGEDVSVPLSSSDNSENNEETRRPAAPGFLEGIELVEGPYTESFLLPDGRSVVVLDEFMQAHLYPPTPSSTTSFASIHKQLSFPMKVASPTGGHRVSGYQFTLSSAVSDKPRAYEAWTLPLQEGEEVQKMFPPSTNGPVASLGKVLGNRTTLYKYLNPRLFVVVSRTHSGASIAGGVEDATEEGGSTTDNQNGTNTPKKSTGKCAIRVLDATKGSVIYHREVASYDDVCDLHASLTENWLVWHYYEGAEDGLGSKGWRVVSVEFYEGGGVDEKTRSSDMSAYSNATLDLTVYEESFVFPHGITAMAPTMTKFGITSKDMICAFRFSFSLSSFTRSDNPLLTLTIFSLTRADVAASIQLNSSLQSPRRTTNCSPSLVGTWTRGDRIGSLHRRKWRRG
ncbi:endoplasmic reticulum protein, variant 2 [Coprinopsis cinerea AmutBmut pab1-1]|nr:endoplasmic reticulum protein, variant 2 [Coprinopsis cinerea AmutBmut pab1-1]